MAPREGKEKGLGQLIKERAKGLGFIACGFLRPQRPLLFEKYEDFLEKGYYGNMTWLRSSRDLRAEPGRLLKGAKTIIVLAYPYPPHVFTTPEGFRVARFSAPLLPDYHIRVRLLLRALVRFMRQFYPQEGFRIFVDSGPLLEKALALQAGIGFMGKNTTLIIPGHGSYFHLGEILTTLELEPEEMGPMASMCGGCELCMGACRQGAIVRPYVLDARLCLSYLTIEYDGELGALVYRNMKDCFYGCDQCQEVCPHNPKGRTLGALPQARYLMDMDEGLFNLLFQNSSLGRGGHGRIKRNLRGLLSGAAIYPSPDQGPLL